ncbi:hypothetical protein [Halorubrum sp. T3]|uniref:hypothetical protein n=1 Tax=Halorubrum sp. T3 TaxID=1194088 RepID=UPI000364B0D0|nr:hypothetical protein [Halorubrum sp. T3]
MDLTEFVPFGIILVAFWILAGSALWAMEISEPFVWYSVFYSLFVGLAEIAIGSRHLSVPRRITDLIIVGFFFWLAALTGYLTSVL